MADLQKTLADLIAKAQKDPAAAAEAIKTTDGIKEFLGDTTLTKDDINSLMSTITNNPTVQNYVSADGKVNTDNVNSLLESLKNNDMVKNLLSSANLTLNGVTADSIQETLTNVTQNVSMKDVLGDDGKFTADDVGRIADKVSDLLKK